MSAESSRAFRPAGVLLLCCLALLAAVLLPGQSKPPWYSILPPLLSVALALLTHRVLPSLGLGVFVGGLLTHVPAAPADPLAWWNGVGKAGAYLSESFVGPAEGAGFAVKWDNVKIMFFVILMMATITVTVASGGLQGIVNRFARFARGSRSAQLATALAGLVVFIDDYANSMIVGNSMRPLTDKHRVSREKLAFLVDATSAPVAGLALVSTWIGFEVSLFQQQSDVLKIGQDGYSVFLDILPFRFYCLMVIAFILVNAASGKDFGPMATAERRARAGDPVGPSAALVVSRAARPDERARVFAAAGVIPLAGLIAALMAGLWADVIGAGRLAEEPAAVFSLANWREVMLAKKDLSLVLAVSGAVSLTLAVGCGVLFSRVPPGRLVRAALVGAKASLLPGLILVLAWSLKAACDGLQTGDFLAAAVGERVPARWFPPLVFVVAGATAFATGTSWTTMLILIPAAAPIAFRLDGGTYGLVTMITLAAVLDGAIFGDHCSPISDTTILSSAASGCDHFQHVRTQAPYSFLVAGLALACGYVPASLGVTPWLGLGAAVAFIVTLFALLKPLGDNTETKEVAHK